jgi:hypothetical protein
MKKNKILFLYSHDNESNWLDGLYAAINGLRVYFTVEKVNLATNPVIAPESFDFILGWGAFGSPADNELQKEKYKDFKKGLCLGGYAPYKGQKYDIIFYETEWSKKWLEEQGWANRLAHAFGINSSIFYKTVVHSPVIFNYITVGTFSLYKRQQFLLNKKGTRFAVGPIQRDNMSESLDIVGDLLLGGVIVSDMVTPHALAEFLRVSNTCYIPAEIMGGGERILLEARACGTSVEICDDNPKLKGLLKCPVWDEKYYCEKLHKGIMEVLNEN